MKTETWWKLCKTLTSVILLSAVAVIGFKYLLPPLLPFILALIISSFIRPAAKWCKKHLGLGAKPVSVIIILAILTLLCLLIWATGTRLISECAKFLVNLSENSSSPDSPLSKLTQMAEGLREKLPLDQDEKNGIDLYKLITELISTGTSKLSSSLATFVGDLIKALPSALFAFGVCFIALFYLTLDFDGAVAAIRDFLPSGGGDRMLNGYRKIRTALGEYFRAYLLIMLVTFAELYLGFTIIGIEYPLLFAVITALVDILPLLGVGTILIPWSAGAFLLGDYKLGIGIIVIYAIVCVVRQFIEPRIIGDFIGTHPVVALAGVYIGLKLFGIVGMIAVPILLYLAKALKEEKSENKSKSAG